MDLKSGNTISIDNIKDALLRSGYLLENRVLKFFQSAGLNATTNHHFPGDEEGKFREIDVMATTSIGYVSLGENLEGVSVYAHFVSECINTLQPIGVFENLSSSGLNPVKLLNVMVNGYDDLREVSSHLWNEALERINHKIGPAKQYCGFVQKNQKSAEWMATHPEDFHRTLTKLTQFVKYDFKQIQVIWEGIRPQNCRIEIIIPLIVLQGEILEIKNNNDLEIVPVPFYKLNAPYEEYSSASIDLVSEKHLMEYFNATMSELKMIFEFLEKELKNHYRVTRK